MMYSKGSTVRKTKRKIDQNTILGAKFGKGTEKRMCEHNCHISSTYNGGDENSSPDQENI